ncbi:MAG: hypothetical protein LBC18_11840 [Opitutaceae bacterium]|jgi:hypothetical protein|nr:hypothetical protein [Opitutaceae bacterium]
MKPPAIRARIVALHLFIFCCLPVIRAELPSPMMGRQSQNEGIRAVPAPGAVKIDGDLSDWDFSGRIWSFADIAIRERYSAETAAMWDKDYLYVALKFNDPTPLVNTINPVFDSQMGWKGDCIQMRMFTDTPLWLTLWYYSPEKRGAALFQYWKDPENNKAGLDGTLLIGEPGAVSIGQGVETAYKPDSDGRGYAQEMRIPWRMIYKAAPAVAAGLTFRMGLEFFWGLATESNWPVHRYADNLQPGKTSREFFWTRKEDWGDVTLLPRGNVEKLTYVSDEAKIEGTIPVRATLPPGAREFTIVIENKDGSRVRNLGAQLNPDLYAVSGSSGRQGPRAVEVPWDGRDDHGGMVPAAEYRVRGLTHQGLGADYIMSFYNPGSPPWSAGAGGGWGADHGPPKLAAAAGDWMILGWSFAEGGHGIIGIGPDGQKRWGEKRGALALAADRQSVYFISRSWTARGDLVRINTTNGAYKPFVLDGQKRPLELPLGEVFGGSSAVPGKVVAMASSGTTLALAMSDGQIALLDPNSARLLKTVPVPAPRAVAFGPGGQCYVVSSGKLAEVNLATGALRAIPTPGLDPGAPTNINEHSDGEPEPDGAIPLAIDRQGNIGLFDYGPDQQIKFFKSDGTPACAAGAKGGRPIRGAFDEQAMSHVSSLAVDGKNQSWVTECWEFPRRVSVWGGDGKLVRDYIGNAGYASTGTFLHDEDPSLGYYGPVEMELDLERRTWKVRQILWVPGEGEQFPVNPRLHAHPHRFTSKAGGKLREFMFFPPFRMSFPYVLYMKGDSGWRPVAAIGSLGGISGSINWRTAEVVRQPGGMFAGRNAYDAFFWNDINRDGRVQRDEVVIQPAPKPVGIGKKGSPINPHGVGWGTRMAPEDLSFVTNGIARYIPLRYTDEGAPVYGPESIRKYANTTTGSGDFVPVLAEKTIIALINRGNFATTGISALDAETGAERWTYPNPYPGVHGSHRAPMPKPGLVIGPLKILGTARLPNDNGHVFGLRGNLGQDYFFTTDGLMIGTVFQDGRFPSMPLPPRESELVHAPMESYGGGGEPFSGWFGEHRDGKIRLTSPMAGQAGMILEMNGFDRVKRFTAPALNVTPALLEKAAVDNTARATRTAEDAEKRQPIARVRQAPGIHGQTRGGNWREIPGFAIKSTASNFKARAQLAHDETNLYIAIDVDDPSPWKNEGADFTRLFKTGDAVDLQLGADPAASIKRTAPVKGDLRVVFAPFEKKTVAVLMRPVNPSAAGGLGKLYSSPVGDKRFDEVRILPSARIGVAVKERGYRLEAAIPLAELDLKPSGGVEIRGDIGFISSDTAGRINTARTYWSNQATNLVSDEPAEAWLTPANWGVFIWGKAGTP